jgi:hypothetical protein
MTREHSSLRSVPRHDPPARGPERARLAAAIAAAQEAEQAADGVRHAIARARDAVAKAETRLETARASVANVKSEQIRRVAASAATGAPVGAASTMKEARAVEIDASDELDIAQAALAQLQAQLPDLDTAAAHAADHRTAAVDIVLRTAAERLLTEARQFEEQALMRRRELYFLRRPDTDGATIHRESLYFYAAQERSEPFEQMDLTINRFFDESFEKLRDLSTNWHKGDAVASWRGARKALMADPDAALPGA